MPRPTLLYFDTNVYQHIHDGGLEQEKLSFLKSRVDSGEIKILISDDIVHELLPIRPPSELLKICQLARNLSPDAKWRGGAQELLKRDVLRYQRVPGSRIRVKACTLELSEHFDIADVRRLRKDAELPLTEDGDLLDWLIGSLRTSSIGDDVRLQTLPRKKAWKEAWNQSIPELADGFAGWSAAVADFSTFRSSLLGDTPEAVDQINWGWVNIALGAVCQRQLRLEGESIRAMRRDVQSFRLFVDIFLSHIYTYAHSVGAERKLPEGSDFGDICHAVFSGFAKYFVTQEAPNKKGLRNRYNKVREAHDPECLSLEELVDRLG